jgi:hypothetical protein
MVELRRVMTMPEEELAYQEIAALYEETFGERIRAGVEWVGRLFHACTTGVACDPDVAACDRRKETIARTTDVLATIFHGREQAELLRQRTAGMKQGSSRSASTSRRRRVPLKAGQASRL